ncbi:DUF6153 family protein [Streptomyces scopuliridis]|uniref:DUF6153 family protein n=1 Tax=Streptomyces scopuliridis TaxID=452529 RepID=UPI0036CD4109
MASVMTGLLAMHGLSPAPSMAAHTASSPAPAASTAAMGPGSSPVPPPSGHVMAAGAVNGDCVHQGDGGGGHLDHADATCAAAGVSAGPALPTSLASALPAGTLDVPAALRQAPGTTAGDRAPPSLSELQLLRI